jgi:hypothetical protein
MVAHTTVRRSEIKLGMQRRTGGSGGLVPLGRTSYQGIRWPQDLGVQSRQSWSYANGGVPSEARNRGSGGGSPRKHDDSLKGPSALGVRGGSFHNGGWPDQGSSKTR